LSIVQLMSGVRDTGIRTSHPLIPDPLVPVSLSP
jgi:hypothetical protein